MDWLKLVAAIPPAANGIIALVVVGGFFGMVTILRSVNGRIEKIEKQYKLRLAICKGEFQDAGESAITDENIKQRLARIEGKLDTMSSAFEYLAIMNGWSKPPSGG